MEFLRTLQATFITLKRTYAVSLAIAAPLFIVCFRLLIFLVDNELMHGRAWNYWFEGNIAFWTGILFVLTISLDIALVVDIDRSAHIWKYLFALPVSRTWIYLSKFIVAIALTFMSGLLLLVASIVVGYLLGAIRPQLGFSLSSPDILYYLWVIFLATLAALLLISFYTWISMRTKNFILPVAISIVGEVINIVGYDNANIQKFFPWIYALDIGRILTRTPQTQVYSGWSPPVILLISIIGAICVTCLGIMEFKRRDIY